MEERKKEARPEGLYDPDRAAYMIAWRDRHIEKQGELIAGYEQELALVQALLALALLQGASEEEGARVVRIPKAALHAALGRYEARVEEGGDAFTVRFLAKKEPQDGGEQSAG